jgi:Uma2 family endonuclease
MTALRKWDEPRPVKLTVDDFLRLDEAGAFGAYAKTELIEGVIVAMNARHRPHGFAKDELAYRLRRALEANGSRHHVSTEVAVAMPPGNLPHPDITLTREPRGEGPIPLASAALIVEISDTTLAFDLGTKARAYAANGVAEFWVVNLPDRLVHQFWSPSPGGYAEGRDRAWRTGGGGDARRPPRRDRRHLRRLSASASGTSPGAAGPPPARPWRSIFAMWTGLRSPPDSCPTFFCWSGPLPWRGNA